MIKVVTNMNEVTNVGHYLVFNKPNWIAVDYHSRNKMYNTKAFKDVLPTLSK